MSKFSRAELDQRRRDRKLIQLWKQKLPVMVIAREMGFNHGSSVSHAATRLGLIPRRVYGRVKPMGRKLAKELATVARVDAILASEEAATLAASLFRCPHCQGRSNRPQGHPSCQPEAA